MLNDLNYTSRLGDIFLFVGNLLNDGLNRDNIFKMTRKLSNNLEDIFDNPKLVGKKLAEREKKKFYIRIFLKNLHVVSNYRIWILNYGWLMICAVFEDFLKDSLNEVLLRNKSLCTWSTREEILLEYNGIKTVKKRINYFLIKLRISEKELFDFSIFKPEIQKKYKDMKLKDVIEIFRKRHDIAHSDKLVIKSVKEFETSKELFDKLIVNASFIINKKWAVETEMCNMRQSISEMNSR